MLIRMPDTRKHRGAHPEDEHLFRPLIWPVLRQSTSHLCWLLSRGYALPSALKLVGDRHNLAKRQRTAVARCACSDESLRRRAESRLDPERMAHRELWIDGYNVLTSIEAALGGAVVLHARDGCYRDMASVHGSYRKVEETVPAIHLLGEMAQQWSVGGCRWFFDRPVSNSGRLKSIFLAVAEKAGWNWQVELPANPDTVLSRTDRVVATADSVILDHCGRWVNLVRWTIEQRVPQARVVDLSLELVH